MAWWDVSADYELFDGHDVQFLRARDTSSRRSRAGGCTGEIDFHWVFLCSSVLNEPIAPLF